MKTKNHPSKARVSKIPPKSYSILALAISEMAKPNITGPESSDIESDNPTTTISLQNHDNIDIDPDATVPETPPSPIHPDEGDREARTCNGKDCAVSIDECDDAGIFYCASCLYKSAIDEFQRVENEFKLAMERAQVARKSMYAFVGGGTVQKQSVESVKVGGTVNPQQGQECEGNGVGTGHNAESDEIVRSQSKNVEDENRIGIENGNSRVEIGGMNDESTSGICNGEEGIRKQNKSMAGQQSSSVSEESCDDNSNGGEKDLDLLDWQIVLYRPPLHETNDAGEMVQNRRENEQQRHSKAKIGIETNNSHHVRRDEDDPFAVYRYQDESGVRLGNNNPRDLRKRPQETSAANISRKSAKGSIKPVMSESKRRRLYWAPEEEEMLIEAVKIFSVKGRKNMSWTSVLDYGRHVFNGTRTSSDLRDKWRNMVLGCRAKQR